MTFRPETMPDIYSQGSSFGLGFDTRITALDSGAEERLSRSPGRRQYEVNLSIWDTAQLMELYKFFLAVARGSLHSFRFKDWLDYATTEDGVTHNGNAVSSTDDVLQLVSGRTYRLTKTYTFGNESYTRNLRHIKLNTFVMQRNGADTMDYVLDDVNGLVTIGGTASITSATFGCEFYTQCRFGDDTDKNFQIALYGKDTGELPSVQLIEDVTDYGWSQDFPAGGAFARTLPPNGFLELNQALGRVFWVQPVDAISVVRLPELTEARAGGPHFAIFNASGSFNLTVQLPDGTPFATLVPFAMVEAWIGVNAAGDLVWLVT